MSLHVYTSVESGERSWVVVEIGESDTLMRVGWSPELRSAVEGMKSINIASRSGPQAGLEHVCVNDNAGAVEEYRLAERKAHADAALYSAGKEPTEDETIIS